MKRTMSACSLLMLTACLPLLLAGAPVHLQAQAADEDCFQETGFCISGRIREYWQENDGLRVFGYPITSQREAIIEGQPVQVQWFERNRLELHPKNDPPFDVLLGRLGAEELQRKGIEPEQTPPRDDCRYFPETGFNVCYDFLRAWQANGLSFDNNLGFSYEESLALFGLPLTGELQQRLSDGQVYTVQYFERARFEYHAENAPPYDVLFGLLGKEIHTALAALPDGRIAFVSDRTGNTDIFVMDPDGSDVTNLTSHPANDFNPRWSPDGITIAFLSDRSGETLLYTMESNGSNPTQLTSLTGIDETFVWSPDGSQIAVAANHTGTRHVYVINADGTNQRPLTDMPSADPSWSPDGTQLAFSALGEDDTLVSISIINAQDGTNLHKPFDLPVAATEQHWSPDGSSFALTTADRGIARIDADGSNFVQIVKGGEINRPYFGLPVWSPDSTRLLFLRYSYEGPYRLYDIYVTGSGELQQVYTRHQSADISWVSNEMILLSATTMDYVSRDNVKVSDRDIYLVNVETSDLTLLTHNDAEDSQPDWWP